MQTKISSSKGWHRLCVADAHINRLFGATQKDPVVLMELSTMDGADLREKAWSLIDWRLTHHREPSRWFSMKPVEMIKGLDEDAMARLKAVVPHYRTEGQCVYWSTFDGVVPGPLQAKELLKLNSKSRLDQARFVDPAAVGVWLFAEGMAQMRQSQEYWSDVVITSAQDMDRHRLPNPRRQITELSFSMSEYALEAREVVKHDNEIKSKSPRPAK